MKKIYWLYLSCIFILSCEKLDTLDFHTAIGEYVETENSDHYFHLQLREDSTYYFSQAQGYSCSLWGHYYGGWEVSKNRIQLYEGINLDSVITVKRIYKLKGDTLRINFEEELINAFPNLTVKFGHDKLDYTPQNNQIILDKQSFLSRNKFSDVFERDEDGEIIYDRFPLEIYIRQGCFYKKVYNFLSCSKIELGINHSHANFSRPAVFLEYKSKNELLLSNGKENWIYQHQLKKGKK